MVPDDVRGTVSLLTVAEAAHRLQVHPRTVYRLLARGALPGHRVGRVWRLPADAILPAGTSLPGSPRSTPPAAAAPAPDAGAGHALGRDAVSRNRGPHHDGAVTANGRTRRAAGLSHASRSRAVWEAAADAMAISDPRGIVLDANPAYFDLYGFRPDDVIGHPFSIIFPEHLRAWAQDGYQQTFADPMVAPMVPSVIQTRDGRERHVEVRYTFLTEHGHRTAMLSVVRDVTERVAAERALVAHAERLQILADSAHHLLLSDQPQTFVPELFRMIADRLQLEVSVNYLVGEDPGMLHLSSSTGIPAAVVERIRSLPVGEAVCGRVAQDGQRIVAEDVQASDDPLTDLVRSLGIRAYACFPLVAFGRLIGTLSFGTRARSSFAPADLDVLETVSAQVAIALERARLSAAEGRALAEAQEALRTRTALLSSISHDLRTPLTTIKGMAQLLSRQAGRSPGPEPGALAASLGIIESAAAHMARITAELLDVAHLYAGQALDLRREPTDLVALVRRAVDLQQATTTRHHLRVATALPTLDGLWDATRVERVLVNLLSNAVKYSPAGGEIVVTVTGVAARADGPGSADGARAGDDRRWAEVVVEDQGLGIPAADLPHVFDYFHRGANVGDAVDGSGIGLAGAKQIVEQHGGTISVRSSEGQGTAVTVRLPRA